MGTWRESLKLCGIRLPTGRRIHPDGLAFIDVALVRGAGIDECAR
ncbi:MAG: hypothetical protein O2968_22495 [Acidobacteria bacterium]|nr:hypothetical protein [Acidobacteriota bacterium]